MITTLATGRAGRGANCASGGRVGLGGHTLVFCRPRLLYQCGLAELQSGLLTPVN